MKTLIFIINIFICFGLRAQTYKASYTVIKTTPLFKLDDETTKKTNDVSLLDLNNIDTNAIKNNKLAVIVGDIHSISNDTICILELTIRKSSHPQYLSKGKSIVCLIDYKNNTIYDQSSNSIVPYKTPHSDSLYYANRLKELNKTDSTRSIVFNWESDIVEVNTSKSIPTNLRASFLDTNNSFGVSTFRTSNQFIKLRGFQTTTESLKKKAEKIKSHCLKHEDTKTLLYL